MYVWKGGGRHEGSDQGGAGNETAAHVSSHHNVLRSNDSTISYCKRNIVIVLPFWHKSLLLVLR